MTAYEASQWTNLFLATAGAAAALTGLVFVAVSINLKEILQLEGVPERALETLLLLLSVLIISIVCLMPGQGHVAVGVELLAVALAFGGAIVTAMSHGLPHNPGHRSWVLSRIAVASVGTIPFVLGAVSVLATVGGGLYWIAFGIVGAISGAVINAWVLLVEILR